ncbi:MAG: hypothetical protein CMJ64_19955 [Planctomycetaceae bacterium]|nr:hypothetical protein [Planctomycetaceae bacterium]
MLFRKTTYCAFLITVTCLIGLGTDAGGGEKVNVGRNVPAGKRVLMDRIDHSTFDALLKK